jgi:hypothetical protein
VVVDSGNRAVRRVTLDGQVSTRAVLSESVVPTGVVGLGDDSLLVVDAGVGGLLRLSPSTVVANVPSPLEGVEVQDIRVAVGGLLEIDYYYRVWARNVGGTGVGEVVHIAPRWVVFESWAEKYLSVYPDLSGPLDDADGDGVVNLLKYAFDMDPGVSSREGLPVVMVEPEFLTLTYRRRTDAVNLLYEVIWSDDLSVWSNEGVTEEVVGQPTANTEEVRATIVIVGEPSKFIRVTVTQQ